MSFRRLLRILMSLVVITAVWWRILRDWRSHPALWVVGGALLTIVLVAVVIFEATGVQDKWKRQRDEVPEKPLGLE